MVSKEILTLVRDRVMADKETPAFRVFVRKRRNPYKISLTLDWGKTPGSWLTFGLNDTEWSAGFLSDQEKEKVCGHGTQLNQESSTTKDS